MVWGWLVASIFILFVGMSMAELASWAPTSGGLYFWTYSLSSPRYRNLLCWIVGCRYPETLHAPGRLLTPLSPLQTQTLSEMSQPSLPLTGVVPCKSCQL